MDEDLNTDDLKKKDSKNFRLYVTISHDLADRLEKVVFDHGFDRSRLVERAIKDILNKIENK